MTVRADWLAAGGSSASFTDITQSILATQNANQQATAAYGFVPSAALLDAIVDAIEAIRAEQLG